jgi:hypothetical protein
MSSEFTLSKFNQIPTWCERLRLSALNISSVATERSFICLCNDCYMLLQRQHEEGTQWNTLSAANEA